MFSNIRKLRNRIGKLEKEIQSISDDLKNKDIALADPVKFKELSHDKEFFEIYDQQQKKLKLLEDEWTSKIDELEGLL